MKVELTLRDQPDILLNRKIKKTYKVLKILGKGTFSVVYQCINLETKQKLAIKLAFNPIGQKMLSHEKMIYRQLSEVYGNGGSGFPKYYEYGKSESFHYLVMQKMSASLEDIFIKMDRKFSIKTVLEIGLQGTQLLQKIHKLGYVHRDVKPGNFLLAHGNKKDKLYLVDFGLFKKFKAKQNMREDSKEKQRVRKFVGTRKFASIAAHKGMKQGKKDDMESLLYTLVYLLKGELPWQGKGGDDKPNRYEEVLQEKESIRPQDLCRVDFKGQKFYDGSPLFKMFRYLKQLAHDDVVNHSYFKNAFKEEIKLIQQKPISTPHINKWRCVGKFDWIDESEKIRSQSNERDHSNEKQKKRSHSLSNSKSSKSSMFK